MNTKNNRRRKESVRRLEEALTQLLQEKELKEITVSELCKRSGLNRSTFYANCADIYDLADRVREGLEREVRELCGSTDLAQGFPAHGFLPLLYHIRGNRLFYLSYFKLSRESRISIEISGEELERLGLDPAHIGYHAEFFRAGFNAVVQMWLAGGCRESPEEIQEIIAREYRGRKSVG